MYREYTTLDLSSAVPSIRAWRLTALPERLSPERIKSVLNSCNRKSVIGKRDYAVLLLLSRLGLRANEVALLKLDDVHWHSASLIIHGKGGAVVTMSLLAEIRAAI